MTAARLAGWEDGCGALASPFLACELDIGMSSEAA